MLINKKKTLNILCILLVSIEITIDCKCTVFLAQEKAPAPEALGERAIWSGHVV